MLPPISNPATQIAPRKGVFLLLRFQATILSIKINKNWFLEELRIYFLKNIFDKFLAYRLKRTISPQKTKENGKDDTI
jgi:hypothetical protein